MSSESRAASLHAPAPAAAAPLQLEDRAVPVPGSDDVLLEVTACGVCRTDLQLCEGDLEARMLPITPGHQIVGRIVAAGGDVVGVELGDRVGVAWLAWACGECQSCRAGLENLCENARFTGWDRDGGFARHVVAHHQFVYPLPAGFGDLDAAPLLCGGVIGYRALCVSGVQPGQRLGLYGFGASATVVIQVARHWGCEVYVATRSEAEQRRALDLGAAWVGHYDERPPHDLNAAITFAPAGDVVVAALRGLARGGTVAINAIHLDRIPEFPYELLWWERVMRSVANVTRQDARELLALAAEIPIVTQHQEYRLDDANTALLDLAAGRVHGAGVIDMG